jgi:hypothetical protein
MRRVIGQGALHAGRVVHWLAEIAIGLLVIIAIGAGALAWRLQQGPLDLPWLVRPLEAAANSGLAPMHVSIDAAALAWEGFHGGSDRPLDIRLTGVRLTGADGAEIAEIPRTAVTLATRALLIGRVVPYSVELDGLRLSLVRAPDGRITLDTGQPQAEPSASPRLPDLINELRRLTLRAMAITVTDQQLGLTWQAPQIAVDLHQPAQGELDGTAAVALEVAGQHLDLTAQAAPRKGNPGTTVRFGLTPLNPAALAPIAPALASLAAADAPVRLSGAADLDPGFALAALRVEARVGAGRFLVGQGSTPVVSALIQAEGIPQRFNLKLARLEVAPRKSGPYTVIQGTAAVERGAATVRAMLDLALDQVAFADLPALWPQGVGGPGSRGWVTTNITDGVASNGAVHLVLQAPADLSDAKLLSIAGGIDGHDLTVHWLRPVPPIEHGDARLVFASPDEIDIAVHAGRQGGLAINGGTVSLTGISGHDQFADIATELSGPLADAIALLKQPRLNLFAHRPLPLQDVAGRVSERVTVSHLPLRDQLSMDDVHISASGAITDARLGNVFAGKDLDQGTLQMQANNDGMKIGGSAVLAGIPAQLSAELDFRNGPPGQVLQKISVSGTALTRQLAGAGLDLTEMMSGPAALQATWQSRRDGTGDASVHADLAAAELHVARLNWSKPAGRAAAADVHLLLDHDRLARIDRLAITGNGIDAQGQLDFAAGQPARLQLQRLLLDPSTDAHGEIRWPARPGEPWVVAVSGPSIDASAEIEHGNTRDQPVDNKPGPPWRLDASFDRVVLGKDRDLGRMKLHAESDGRVTRQVQLTASTAGGKPLSITIAPAGRGRRLTGSAEDAGGVLRALDVYDNIQGGTLTLNGTYDDANPEHPLSGTAEITDFRVHDAPGLGKVLQAMTLYGLVDALGGSGLGFTHLVAPFRLTDDMLDLDDARAYSSSLGLTAKGRIDLARNVCDVQGTIVPAYFFNSLLGGIPLVGKLLVPEKGGGVFAATYSLSGKCDDPGVGVNPLAALTPGFLRGLFGEFKGGDAPASPRAAGANR